MLESQVKTNRRIRSTDLSIPPIDILPSLWFLQVKNESISGFVHEDHPSDKSVVTETTDTRKMEHRLLKDPVIRET